MPSTPRDDEFDDDTYTLVDLQAMEAAGDIELAMPGTPEHAVGVRAMIEQLRAHDRELVAREGPDAMTSDRDLRLAALAAEQDPHYVAHALADARARLMADHAGLATWLHVTPSQLAALAIQPRPDPSAPTFVEQVQRLAEHYGADPGRLADALDS